MSNLRQSNLDALDGAEVDVLVVGGGINGAVSAAALADRGLSVALAERRDFAGMTSQESSNFVWGGLKYLENYELALVWKLCRSRNELMRSYPTTVTEIEYLATLDQTAPFPAWLAGLGSLAYWGIGAFATARPHLYRPSGIEQREPVIATGTASAGLQYADAYLPENDARFVWSFIRSALDQGAMAANYLSVDSLEREDRVWTVAATDLIDERAVSLRARAVINAGGPLVGRVAEQAGVSTRHRVVYSKGIHLVVPRLTDSERILAFFDDTRRLFYVIPMAHRSVIGTTDTRTNDPDEAVTDQERRFLLDQINARLNLDQPLGLDDVIAERCGVRPLVVKAGGDDQETADWTALSRKHEVEIDRDRAMVSIFGGKLTDCLNVGHEMVDAVRRLGLRPGPGSDGWYGEPSIEERNGFLGRAAGLGLDRVPEVERAETISQVLWRRHGRAAHEALTAIEADPSMAEVVLAESDLLRAEIDLFARREMIVTAEDFLRRRTKLALIHRPEALAASAGLGDALQRLGLAAPAPPPVQTSG